MGKKKTKKIPLCAYCGVRPGITKDHVIPRCLFPGPLPIDGDAAKVPACEECNQAKAENDPYLRDMLVTDWCASGSPAAKQLWSGPVLRAFNGNRSDFARAARDHVNIRPVHTIGGVYLGHAPSAPLDPNRVNAIFKTMVRGLYYRVLNKTLPDRYVFEIGRVDPFRVQATIDDFQRMKANGPYIPAPGVFGCMFMYADEDPFITHWLLWFYDSVFFTVSSDPPEGERETWWYEPVETAA